MHRIVYYSLKRFGPDVAERVVHDLESAFRRLAEHPGMGHRREDLTDDENILFWIVGPTVVAYRSDASSVLVLFLERGELDWERVLKSDISW